jgi:hypothetical protein
MLLKGVMRMTRKPRTLLLVAAVGAVVFFLLGAPEISEGMGTLQDVVAWLSLIVGVLTLAALVLGVWGLVTHRRQSSSQG